MAESRRACSEAFSSPALPDTAAEVTSLTRVGFPGGPPPGVRWLLKVDCGSYGEVVSPSPATPRETRRRLETWLGSFAWPTC